MWRLWGGLRSWEAGRGSGWRLQAAEIEKYSALERTCEHLVIRKMGTASWVKGKFGMERYMLNNFGELNAIRGSRTRHTPNASSARKI